MTQPASKSYTRFQEEKITSEFLRNKLKLKSLEVKNNFNEKYPHVKKFFDERGVDFNKIREHSAKIIASTALTGTVLFSSPLLSLNLSNPIELVKNLSNLDENKNNTDPISISNNQLLLTKMKDYLPTQIGPLTRSQEKNLEKIFKDVVGISAKGTLEGEHLNTTYGLIGAEQHLARFPGDSMAIHPKIPQNDEGMAPGLGAWGYVPAKEEEWYAVVQTLYLPDWSSRLSYLGKWYHGRKLLIVNTLNGNAVIADVQDSGPAAFTGKQFGGSPEVMNYLGGSRYKKGPVVVFFVDDPENKIPLGPIDYNSKDVPNVILNQV